VPGHRCVTAIEEVRLKSSEKETTKDINSGFEVAEIPALSCLRKREATSQGYDIKTLFSIRIDDSHGIQGSFGFFIS